MIQIREAAKEDFEEVVNMFYDLTKETFKHRTIKEKYHFFKVVLSWYEKKYQIILTLNDNVISGFYVAFVDNFSHLTEPFYFCAEMYLKKEFRKTKAFYLMQENLINISDKLKMPLVCEGLNDEISKIHIKKGGFLLKKVHERGIHGRK